MLLYAIKYKEVPLLFPKCVDRTYIPAGIIYFYISYCNQRNMPEAIICLASKAKYR